MTRSQHCVLAPVGAQRADSAIDSSVSRETRLPR